MTQFWDILQLIASTILFVAYLIVLFHVVLDPGGAVLSLILLALGLYLAWTRRDAYAGVLRAKEETEASSPKLRTREILAAE